MATGTNLLDGSTNLSRIGWDVGFYARLYPLAVARGISRYFNPWVSMGVGYQHDRQSFRKTLTIADSANILADIAIDHHALSMPLGIGLDVRVVKFLSVGPSFELVVDMPVAGCVSTRAPGSSTPTYCSRSDPGKEFLAAATYLAWNAGLDVKLTF